MNPESKNYVAPLLALLCLATAPVAAQSPSVAPGGFWYEISAAAGSTRLTCEVCDPDRELGPSLGVAVGAYASSQLRIGVEGGRWTHLDDDVREKVYRVGLTAQLHPRAGSGLHLVGGLGWSGYRAQDFTYDAFRLTVGAGWDLPLTSSFVVGNRLLLDGSSFASLENDGTPLTGLGGDPLSVGLSVLRFEVFVRRR